MCFVTILTRGVPAGGGVGDILRKVGSSVSTHPTGVLEVDGGRGGGAATCLGTGLWVPHLSGGLKGVTFEWGAESIIFEFRSLEHSGEMETVLTAQLAIPVCS